MTTKHLDAAKARRYDEYYTSYEDVERELLHYKPEFKGKSVYCNCDGEESAFWRFFKNEFHTFGLKLLTATGIGGEKLVFDGTDVKRSKLEDGRYQSDECKAILADCDIVVTNPPFSLWRDFWDTVFGSGKKFMILGHLSCASYVNVFPALREGKAWYGSERGRATYWFDVPEDAPKEVRDKLTVHNGRPMRDMRQIVWITNLHHDVPKHLECTAHYDPEKYPHYSDYDAIEVGFLKDIPCDYDGKMGVPLTFLNNHDHEQFDLLDNVKPHMPDGSAKFQRYIIQRHKS